MSDTTKNKELRQDKIKEIENLKKKPSKSFNLLGKQLILLLRVTALKQ